MSKATRTMIDAQTVDEERTVLGRKMRRATGTRRGPWSLVTILLALLAAAACGGGGGDGGGGAPDPAEFVASGTQASADLVRLEGTGLDENTVLLDIVIDGPTTSTDLFNFNIELVVSESGFVQLDADSTEAGDALSNATAVSGQEGDRITVGVTKTSQPGEQIGSGEHSLATFRVDLLSDGATDIQFDVQASGAEDSNGAAVGSIEFDDQPAQLLR